MVGSRAPFHLASVNHGKDLLNIPVVERVTGIYSMGILGAVDCAP